MKKAIYILFAVLILIISGYLFIRFFVLKTKTDHPVPAAKSLLDLRPAMINKIEDVVKEGSGGLYNAVIEKLEPDVLHSTVDLYNVTINPDSAAIKKLDSLQKLPDDIFKISFQQLHITGISPADFLNKKTIDLDDIVLTAPEINVFHKARPYNAQQRKADSEETLYQKLTKQFSHISVRTITGKDADFTRTNINNGNKKRKFTAVNISLSDLLIDSSTQFDKSRVLFSKEFHLSAKNYVSRTADSLYEFKIGGLEVSAAQHQMTATDVDFLPRYGKEAFEKKLTYIKDRFILHFPKLVFNGIDWWHLMMNESLACDEADMYDAEIDDYLDESLPHSPIITVKNIPQQLLKTLSLKINVKKLAVHNSSVVYEEFSPASAQSGTIYFTAITGILTGITNMPAAIKENSRVFVNASGLFMKTVPMKARFMFDLAKSGGNFSTDIDVGSMDSAVLNPVARSLGLVEIKEGIIHSGSAHVEGDDFGDSARVLMLYNNMHLVPLKNVHGEGLKKKKALSFIANTFILKKNNPAGDKPAVPVSVSLVRDSHGNFFNFVWSTLHKGILKTLGVPGN